MVGLERTVLPLLAEEEFGLASTTVALSFLVSFGLVKAATNFFAGRLGDLYGRKEASHPTRSLVVIWRLLSRSSKQRPLRRERIGKRSLMSSSDQSVHV